MVFLHFYIIEIRVDLQRLNPFEPRARVLPDAALRCKTAELPTPFRNMLGHVLRA